MLSLQGGWGAQARSRLHSTQGGGRIVRQESEHGQTGDGEPRGPTRSGSVGTCASPCPSLTCWAAAPSACPPLRAPSSPGLGFRERRGCPHVPHLWPCNLAGCSSARAALGCSAPAKVVPPRRHQETEGRHPGTPHLLSDACTVSFPLAGLFPTQPSRTGSAHAVPVLKLSHTEEEEGECHPCAFSPCPPLPCSMSVTSHVPALRLQALKDNPSLATLLVPGALIKEQREERTARNVGGRGGG